ncbi:DUF2846 domain-containing protein [Ottowia testudinis]|uniref:DUF2846 domain-containing protein n=1 Tax=Ottowia testudinis TaxID=2816950 RepID=A0A975CJH9_9BURK|nr:DUF2846 domain-containing protein [Ottowia testudinis]QTD45329.1 DUF2846 domain-containing protein [Ottowia testudinis]
MKNLFSSLALVTLLSGCASVNMASKEASDAAKTFKTPPRDQSALYVYRDSAFGRALTKDIFVNDECLGKSAPDVFFYKALKPNQKYKISSESEFSPNDLMLTAEPGKNHFVRQYITLGLFVGGASLEVVPEETGKAAIAKLSMAEPGKCGR